MIKLNPTKTIAAAICASMSFSAAKTEAGTASVGVSISFEVAPIDLIRPRNIAPAKLRACKALKARVNLVWAAKTRGPNISCTSPQVMPLIANDLSTGTLVVRP